MSKQVGIKVAVANICKSIHGNDYEISKIDNDRIACFMVELSKLLDDVEYEMVKERYGLEGTIYTLGEIALANRVSKAKAKVTLQIAMINLRRNKDSLAGCFKR